MLNIISKQMDLLTIHNSEMALQALLDQEEAYKYQEYIDIYDKIFMQSNILDQIKPNFMIIDDLLNTQNALNNPPSNGKAYYNQWVGDYTIFLDQYGNLILPCQLVFNFNPPEPIPPKLVSTTFYNNIGKRKKKGGRHTW